MKTMFFVSGIVSGIALGAGLMYVLDPQQGQRRRAMIRDRAFRGGRVGRRLVEKSWRDLVGRGVNGAADGSADGVVGALQHTGHSLPLGERRS